MPAADYERSQSFGNDSLCSGCPETQPVKKLTANSELKGRCYAHCGGGVRAEKSPLFLHEEQCRD